MMESIRDANKLAKTYGIPVEDILLISLNSSGMKTDLPYKRVRFKLQFPSRPPVYLGVPVLHSDTSFYLSSRERRLLFDDDELGKILDAENDGIVMNHMDFSI